jgi:hypothetical protein
VRVSILRLRCDVFSRLLPVTLALCVLSTGT